MAYIGLETRGCLGATLKRYEGVWFGSNECLFLPLVPDPHAVDQLPRGQFLPALLTKAAQLANSISPTLANPLQWFHPQVLDRHLPC